MQATPEPLVLEPAQGAFSDRDLGILGFGCAAGVIAVGLAAYYLPPGFVLIFLLILGYPAIGLWRTIRRDWARRAPRLVLGPEALEVGGQLRIRWRDVAEIGTRLPPGSRPGVPEWIGIRLNRAAPVQPVPSTLRRLGLGAQDGQFDITIPPRYQRSAAEIAAAMEALRAQAVPPARPVPLKRPAARPRARKSPPPA